jgi:hypothetical protein
MKKQILSYVPLFALLLALCAGVAPASLHAQETGMSIAVFDLDVTPPLGSHLAYDSVVATWDMGLRARGIVLLGAEEPIVLCAVDWIGIGNESHDAFREVLARAAHTVPGRVAVHTIHQHDAPGCDFTTERIALSLGAEPRRYESTFQREVLVELEKAVTAALEKTEAITHFGLGSAPVYEVASNRRLLDENGKVRVTRFTSCPDPEMRAEPEGLIDPEVSLVSFWKEETPLAVLSYYATHPQSYYRTGIPNPDFPGLARFFRQLEVPSALHVHFNGAGSNLGAGKYNDGSRENRLILAQRLADGMKRAWEDTERFPISADVVGWEADLVTLPTGPWLTREIIEARFNDQPDPARILGSASKLAWLERQESCHQFDITCLSLGKARILHMPGELFVEYQLAAKKQRPDLFVAMAAYGDYSPGYIGTAIAYEQGGYETSEAASNVAPEVEQVLLGATARLLGDPPAAR